MKGNIAVQKHKNEKLQDDGKLAYMIAWRDKRIAALEDLLRAQTEADAVYAAYIVYLLERCGTDCEGGCEIHVPKQEIRSVCGKYAVEAKDAENDFIITLTKQGESHGAGSCEVADA